VTEKKKIKTGKALKILGKQKNREKEAGEQKTVKQKREEAGGPWPFLLGTVGGEYRTLEEKQGRGENPTTKNKKKKKNTRVKKESGVAKGKKGTTETNKKKKRSKKAKKA